jgi:hypothetical protein
MGIFFYFMNFFKIIFYVTIINNCKNFYTFFNLFNKFQVAYGCLEVRIGSFF